MDHEPVDEGVAAEPGANESRGRRGSRTLIVAWAAAIVLPIVFGLALVKIVRTGRSPSELAKAYGLSIANSRAEVDKLSRSAPAIRGESLEGTTLDLASFRGRVVVLNLWGSWCGPCRAEEPALESMWERYQSRGVQFLGLNIRDDRASARAFREEFHVTYPTFFDPSAALTYRLGVQVLPTTFVIDSSGRLALRFTGRVDERLLGGGLDEVLSG